MVPLLHALGGWSVWDSVPAGAGSGRSFIIGGHTVTTETKDQKRYPSLYGRPLDDIRKTCWWCCPCVQLDLPPCCHYFVLYWHRPCTVVHVTVFSDTLWSLYTYRFLLVRTLTLAVASREGIV
jgi:hypothetical protein